MSGCRKANDNQEASTRVRGATPMVTQVANPESGQLDGAEAAIPIPIPALQPD